MLQKSQRKRRYFIRMRLKRKMSGIQQMNFRNREHDPTAQGFRTALMDFYRSPIVSSTD